MLSYSRHLRFVYHNRCSRHSPCLALQEVHPPLAYEFVESAAGSVHLEQTLKLQVRMCNAVGWRLQVPTVESWLTGLCLEVATAAHTAHTHYQRAVRAVSHLHAASSAGAASSSSPPCHRSSAAAASLSAGCDTAEEASLGIGAQCYWTPIDKATYVALLSCTSELDDKGYAWEPRVPPVLPPHLADDAAWPMRLPINVTSARRASAGTSPQATDAGVAQRVSSKLLLDCFALADVVVMHPRSVSLPPSILAAAIMLAVLRQYRLEADGLLQQAEERMHQAMQPGCSTAVANAATAAAAAAHHPDPVTGTSDAAVLRRLAALRPVAWEIIRQAVFGVVRTVTDIRPAAADDESVVGAAAAPAVEPASTPAKLAGRKRGREADEGIKAGSAHTGSAAAQRKRSIARAEATGDDAGSLASCLLTPRTGTGRSLAVDSREPSVSIAVTTEYRAAHSLYDVGSSAGGSGSGSSSGSGSVSGTSLGSDVDVERRWKWFEMAAWWVHHLSHEAPNYKAHSDLEGILQTAAVFKVTWADVPWLQTVSDVMTPHLAQHVESSDVWPPQPLPVVQEELRGGWQCKAVETVLMPQLEARLYSSGGRDSQLGSSSSISSPCAADAGALSSPLSVASVLTLSEGQLCSATSSGSSVRASGSLMHSAVGLGAARGGKSTVNRRLFRGGATAAAPEAEVVGPP